MRSARLLVCAALLAPAVGCTWLKNHTPGQPRPTGEVPEVQASQLVDHLNIQAGRLQSLEYEDAEVQVSGRGMMTINLQGNLVATQPRYFRMRAQPKLASGAVDLGSNPEQCWVYLKAPGDEPFYGYATHADFQSGKAQLPGGIKFDPDWVMQALGMTTLPPDARYEVKKSQKDRTYTLSWPATGPGGQPVRKEVVFDADTATDNRPQVKKHLVWDDRTRKLIASAEVKAAHPTGTGGQYPTRVVLRWEEQRFEMDLDLRQRPARVNQLTSDNAARQGEFARFFARPDSTYRGTSPIDLARYESPPGR
ncbi:MAG: hypothetical protein K2X87_23920 [Gemmataceae bacterium]|nr:hypothetical protein [Gemmataceae bacterium]